MHAMCKTNNTKCRQAQFTPCWLLKPNKPPDKCNIENCLIPVHRKINLVSAEELLQILDAKVVAFLFIISCTSIVLCMEHYTFTCITTFISQLPVNHVVQCQGRVRRLDNTAQHLKLLLTTWITYQLTPLNWMPQMLCVFPSCRQTGETVVMEGSGDTVTQSYQWVPVCTKPRNMIDFMGLQFQIWCGCHCTSTHPYKCQSLLSPTVQVPCP